jgi:glycosyltransferase involved in cell wall biosynthesis
MTDVIHPEMRTQDWGWAYKFGDIHVVHYSFDKRLGKLKPKVFMAHGTPEAVLESSLRDEDDQRALLSGGEWINRFEGAIVTSQRGKMFWGAFDSTGGKRMHLVNKGIDLEWWQRSGTTQDLPGTPSVLYGEVWRGIKHPGLLFYAMDELYKRNNLARLNAWSLTVKRNLWEGFIGQAGFWKFIDQDRIPGVVDYPEHYYSRGDVLVSPVTAGDLSRVAQEAMACGCPVVSWDTDPYGENHPYKFAKGFDVVDMADKIHETYEEVLDDREGVAAKCRKTAETYFDIDEEARSIVQILRKIVSEQ